MAFGLVAFLFVIAVLTVGPVMALQHRNVLPFERQIGHLAIRAAAMQQRSAVNPVAGNQRAISNGRDAYTGSCAVCHGANGDGKGVFGQSLYPPVPDLRDTLSRELSDGEMFWIIKNGLSFVGMPAFHDRYEDQSIWSLVAYIRVLQQGTVQALNIPEATPTQLASVNPFGTAEQRGAAIYFAQGCQLCHGPIGNAPQDLRLRDGRETQDAVRRGKPGMPKYPQNIVSDNDVNDLASYLNTFSAGPGTPRT